MRLGVFLALVATSAALNCNVGTLVTENGVIIHKNLQKQPCGGMCSRSSVGSHAKSIISLDCQENEIAIFRYKAEGYAECSAAEPGQPCLCSEELCADIKAEENLIPPPQIDDVGAPTCYVGYYARNGTNGQIILNNGVTTNCGTGMACASITGTTGNTYIETYLCTTPAVCTAAIGKTNGTGPVVGDNVNMACCTNSDCRYIVTNKDITVPTTVTVGNNSITCMQGAQFNYVPFGGVIQAPCSGSCSSVSIKTTNATRPGDKNGQIWLLDLFTCDPVQVCDAVGLNNACGNIALNNMNSAIRGCCCNTNNCINPTASPPIYPMKTLKCWTGIYIRDTGFNAGAEMVCAGKCGRIEAPISNNGSTTYVTYMSCVAYPLCQGLGIGEGDQSYNPPMEEETTITCCSSKDNCNINPYDAGAITPNVTNIPTTNYPILCYNNIHLNGNPISTPSYSMCSGECAMASFYTVAFGQVHNTTIYTCDPVTLCKQVGITNGCASVNGTGVTACCCDDDTCFDPTRTNRANMMCYTGVYVKEDNYLNGGETLCNGWCASLGTMVNNKTVTTYWCAPVRTCRSLALGMGGDSNCNSIPGANPTLTGCCCADSDNCNLPPNLLPNVTSLPVAVDPPIICYEAIYVNGAPQGNAGYRICNGNCVSMSMGIKVNGNVNMTTLYTCDSSNSCNALGLRNGCGSVDGTVYSCCCNSDACIDPTVNRSPDQSLTCFVGVNSPIVFAGADVTCNGKCANLTTSANGISFTSYHCVPNTFCRGLSLDNSCNQVQLDRAVSGCCCDNSFQCNAAGTNLTGIVQIAPPEAPIACYSGLHINHTTWTAGSGWSTCFGDCMVLSMNTTYNNQPLSAAVYTCDPTSVCSALNITNRCHNVEPGVFGCCCSDSGCIDPTKNPPKFPLGRPITCYNGIVSGYGNLSAGAEQPCDGSCASLTSTVGGANLTVFSCVPKTICSQLGLYDTCQTLNADRAITGCCCDNADNCNKVGFVVPPPAPREHDFPIVCFQGIFLNNRGISVAGWQSCLGDCALIAFNTTVNNTRYEAEWYTCDPAAVCHQIGVVNRCHEVEPGVQGCCCDTDACLDPTYRPPKKPGPPRKCYVGVKSTQLGARPPVTPIIDVGAETYCPNGMCANIWGFSGIYNVTTFFCAPTTLCKSLQLDNQAKPLPIDNYAFAMCCDYQDNCNTRGFDVNTSRPISPPEYPITCYSGIFVNGFLVSAGSWLTCNGDCALISMNSTLQNGTTYTADLYTCDPSSVCRGLNMVNSCTSLESGLSGCCCDSNGCLDPTKRPAKKPGQLMCYVGFNSPSYPNVTAGAAVACNGRCASLAGIVGGVNLTAFACVDTSICRSLNLDGAGERRFCDGIPGDRGINACCCDNYNYCNTMGYPNISIPAPNPNVEFPITCWNGLTLNGNYVNGQSGSWSVCNGDCASVSITTAVNGMNNTLNLYTCDPSSICTTLKTRNSCQNLEPGVSACCCDSDACINPMRNKSPANPLTCYVGVQSNYPTFKNGIGATVYCNGKCASLSGTVGGYNTTTFHCVDNSICKFLELDNACSSLSNRDREVRACCCDNGPTCNLNQAGVSLSPIPPVQNATEPYIACYSGIYLNGNPVTPGTYQACQGDCASVTLNTSLTVNNVMYNHTATLYTCDPSVVCRNLNVSNACGDLEPGMRGCCCDTDACIDPTKNRSPDIQLWCYVGVYNGLNNVSIGDSVLCDGGRKCMSLSTTFQKKTMKVYQCVESNICSGIGLDNQCNTQLAFDQDVTACCCDNAPNCNSLADPVGSNPLKVNYTGAPIACWSGLYLNGQPLTKNGWTSCKGDCASMQLNTNLTGTPNVVTLFTCDPATVCSTLNIVNTCAPNIDAIPGLTGCCCSTDACMDANNNVPKNQNINCFAGLVSNFTGSPNGVMANASIPCAGRCASLSSTVAGFAVTAYQCIDTNVCRLLGIDGTCNTLQYDRAITGCCCSNGDYCNIKNTNIPIPQAPNYTEPAIACYSGLWVNGASVGASSYTACFGKCASIAMNTTFNGLAQTATLYTCDPSDVCSALNTTNTCNSPETGIVGCCCDTDACIDPNYGRYPGRQLSCYVGAYNSQTNQSVGAYTTCDGKCGSVKTYLNNYRYKAYFCLNQAQTEALGVDNGCRTIPADREVIACVCDNANNCNVESNEFVSPGTLNITFSGSPIACWSGAYVNGVAQGSSGWIGCVGNCATIQLQTSVIINQVTSNHTLALYTCDPAAACTALGLNNGCGNVDAIPGLTGCCCNFNACVDSSSIYPKAAPPTTSASALSPILVLALTAVYTLRRFF